MMLAIIFLVTTTIVIVNVLLGVLVVGLVMAFVIQSAIILIVTTTMEIAIVLLDV
jgi:hypothetical protein